MDYKNSSGQDSPLQKILFLTMTNYRILYIEEIVYQIGKKTTPRRKFILIQTKFL